MEAEDLGPYDETLRPADPAVPEPQAMRLVIAVYDQAIEVDVLDCLQELGIEHYTRWAGAQGAGRTGRREGSPVFPGLNNVLLLAVAEDMLAPLLTRLYELRATFPMTPAMRVMVGNIALY
jgi:hypothetical protein